MIVIARAGRLGAIHHAAAEHPTKPTNGCAGVTGTRALEPWPERPAVRSCCEESDATPAAYAGPTGIVVRELTDQQLGRHPADGRTRLSPAVVPD